MLDLRWIYVGFTLDLRWIYVGFTLDLRWIYVGFTLDLRRCLRIVLTSCNNMVCSTTMKAITGNDKVSGCRYFSSNFKKKGKKIDRRIRRHKDNAKVKP